MKIFILTIGSEILKTSIESFTNSVEIEANENVFLNPDKYNYIDEQIILKENANNPLFQVPWHVPEKSMRLFVTHENNSKLSIAYPELALWFKMQENPIVAIDSGLIVYLNTMTDVSIAGNVIPLEVIQSILQHYDVIVEVRP